MLPSSANAVIEDAGGTNGCTGERAKGSWAASCGVVSCGFGGRAWHGLLLGSCASAFFLVITSKDLALSMAIVVGDKIHLQPSILQCVGADVGFRTPPKWGGLSQSGRRVSKTLGYCQLM